MRASTLPKENLAALNRCAYPADSMTVQSLTDEHREEVLAFLATRPIHTFGLAGFIRDNGLVSPHNRGTFYGCRNDQGSLEGVALIGHFILFETLSTEATAAFARIAQECTT